jgi:hypothetical protein
MPDIAKLLSPPKRDRANTNGAGTQPDDPTAMVRVTSPVRTRRRPIVLGIGILLVVILILGSVALVNGLRQTQDILVLARDVPQGQMFTSDDFTSATVNTDAGLHVISASDLAAIVGRAASTNLASGTVLNPNTITDAVIPGKGLTMVGITVGADKLPATPLLIGDDIRIIDTPRDQDNSPVQAPISSNAQVVRVQPLPEIGQTTVDVLVPEAEANWVAARAATHRVALVLDTRVR